MEDVHVYVERPPGKEEGAGLQDLREVLKALDHVSEVDVNASGNVVAVSYDGGKEEREEIKRAVEAAGYKVWKLSVRSEFEEPERGLWDI